MLDEQHDKAKFLKPHLHFTTSLLKIGDDYTTEKIEITELVKANDTLATFKNFEIYEKKGYQKAPLEPSENTRFAEDGESIIAAIAGYPKVTKKMLKGSKEMLTLISIEPLIIVSPDDMKAVISLHPPIEGVPPLTETSLMEAITEHGITYGIAATALAKINKIINEKEIEFNKVVFAKGTPVSKSIDSYLRFDMEIGPIAGTIQENGSIDFRDRRIMVGVNEDQCIATKIPAIPGEAGINIFGKETPARTPVDVKVRPLNDATFIKETNQVIATKAGVLSIVNKNVIKVLSHQLISGDIGYKTGNVDSKNCVTIDGSVQPGFKVNTVGDLKISGGIMSASITSDANLVISGGITGKNSVITATGDCDINFIEQGKLTCGGLCVIRKQSYYGEVIAEGDIRCKPQSILVGGSLFSGGSMTLFDVGATDSIPSLIAAGVIASRLVSYNKLRKSIVAQEEEIVDWLQRYTGSGTSRKIRNMERELAEAKLQRLRVNLIPGTGIYSRVAGPDDVPKNDRADYSAEDGIAIDQITIDAHGTIFRDTKIRIGNKTLKLEKTVTNRQFKLHPNGKRIIAIPLKKG
ncbi:MAG: hypothetical protein COA36_07050 [Desulfotalea sp.]|nr:MAG: hypothetical protein COA36_07050 [Desulfotalea sp.]